jgi:hypothetical protein
MSEFETTTAESNYEIFSLLPQARLEGQKTSASSPCFI